ncbi:MAG: CRTAC1 family protein, partial [Bacteroidetes bacterium]|nr:CRTAC1 family protein [Bacteroidota bacterium]
MKGLLFLWLALMLLCMSECTTRDNQLPLKPSLFTRIPSAKTGITFTNNLSYSEEFNVYTYRSFYNGAGVGLGDVNNDGLVDIFFCGNQVSNKLYMNLGNFRFRDITDQAGLASAGVWSTGVSMVDVNGDGWLDIYVCKSGNPKGERRSNELFINNRDLTFTEMSESYRINDQGLSTHAVFFDYDKDGDLDCYLLNNSFRSVGNYDLRKDQRLIRDTLGGNRLYRNEGNRFKDVSEEAGIYGSSIGFGLGVTVGDVDKDGWEDIYVSNDFFEKDYLYINQKNGRFKEELESHLQEISMGSMGADMADINNDGFQEIFVTEMLPEGEGRLKTKAQFENWQKYQLNFSSGYYRQFPRNVLQLNNMDGSFSEVGRLAGVDATDWSWGALIADLDNDGFKDIFVANGIYKDLLDQDYVNFMADPNTVSEILRRDNQVIKKLVDMMPSEPLPNYAFHNNHDLSFTNLSSDWGLADPGFSNGSAYGDLDNDGDLDLVVNNVNMESFVFRNNADSLFPGRHYLKFSLRGEGNNKFAYGTQITIRHRGQTFYLEAEPMKGFQSNVDHRLHFGLDTLSTVDTVIVKWPDARITLLTNLNADQEVLLNQKDAGSGKAVPAREATSVKLLSSVDGKIGITYHHKENDFVDFDRDRLLYHMMSTEGPRMSVGDVNGDHLDDFY